MIKHTNGLKIVEKLTQNTKNVTRIYPGALTKRLSDYMKSSIRAKSNNFILHVGTNDLNSNAPQDESSKTITNLASKLKSGKSGIVLSSIITRADKLDFKKIKQYQQPFERNMWKRRTFSHWSLQKDQSKSCEG